MKQLTVAYNNNDLHTLLSLELAWIQKEENNPANLPDIKLKVYNEVLEEQVSELEQEIDKILQHPRYEPLQHLLKFPYHLKTINIKKEKTTLEIMVNEMSVDIEKLKGNERQALKVVKEIISEYEMYGNNLGDFSMIFG